MPDHTTGVVVRDDMVVIYLDRDGAEWLAEELPAGDGFVHDLWAAVRRIDEARRQEEEQ